MTHPVTVTTAQDSRRGRTPTQRGRIRARILDLAASGTLRPGQVLPTEAALAALFGASQPTVHREMKRLVAEGVLAFDGEGRRILAERRSGLLGRTVAMFTAYGVQPPGVNRRSEAWEASLENLTWRALQRLGLFCWQMPAEAMGERELRLLDRDRPGVALVFAASLPSSRSDAILAALAAAHVPAVVYGTQPAARTVDAIASDHISGGDMACRRLVDLGCRRLICQQGANQPVDDWLARRLRGAAAAAAQAGLAVPGALTQPPQISDAHGEAVRFQAEVVLLAEALRPHVAGPLPLGILAMSDGEVPRLWGAVRRLGLAPGRDVLVAGYDGYWADLHERSWEPTPPSLTVDKRHGDIADVLAATADRRLREPAAAPVRRLLEPAVVGPGAADAQR